MKSSDSSNVYLIMNCPVSPNSMGGGDRIMIENARRWNELGFKVSLFACEEGAGMCRNNSLSVPMAIISRFPVARWGMVGAYILRMIKAIFSDLPIGDKGIIYGASDFLPDTIPAFKKKMGNKDLKWVVGFYLRARNPFVGEIEITPKSILFFLQQQGTIILMKLGKVDMTFVLSEEDRDYLIRRGFGPEMIKIVSGGVNVEWIEEIAPASRKYEACFVGRFHEQKGLPELMEVWDMVVGEKKDARLAIIGWGPSKWVSFLRDEIKRRNLEKNVDLLGFKDGKEKYAILKAAKIFVFTSNYESWGLVTIEAMACGLPVIAFDLPVLKRNLKRGAFFVPLKDTKKMSKAILELLTNKRLYLQRKKEALSLAEEYDWDKLGKITASHLKCLL